ncbi:aluminum-activated malate transporter 10 [Gastrolobium bilobum]|uniref:aluminum-activated malate transporter 10 n=1 Tax=Gastrolobium bilobum TaxID=150636 RepID=UPI002AB1AD4F|nr:aluminum-activated malate transporter 10 [Gastrolobium bilobum]
MADNKKVEWRIKMANGSSEKAGQACMWGVISALAFKVCNFLKKAWELGVNDPRKFIHCLKVGIALTTVSLVYYMKPLYDGFGGNAIWAVITVVVVFEYTAGATICKSINRICGTSLAGLLGIGVHWVASRAGKQFEPFIVGVSVFLLASAATFSRFIPTIKARFDYGAVIFILTFSLVSVSGYRIDKLLDLAQERLSTVIIGTILCIIVSMSIRPIWAGQELHVLTTGNLDKLANSLQGCVAQYFSSSEAQETVCDEVCDKKLLGYKCILSSKASEDSMANFARWEPAHGHFNFRHPWRQYLKIGASMRTCASVIDALIGCINSENKVTNDVKNHISNISLKVGANSAGVIRELVNTIRNMKKSSEVGVLVAEMNSAAQELQDVLKSYPNLVNTPPSHNDQGTETEQASSSSGEELAPKIEISLMDVIQVGTVASLLIEIVARVEHIVSTVEELSELAEFEPVMCIKSKQNIEDNNKSFLNEQKDDEDMKTLQIV